MGYTTKTEKTWGEVIGGCLAALIIVFLLDCLSAWVIQLIWNILALKLFHGPQIDFWTAFLIVVALSIVGGFFKSHSSSSKS